MQRYHYDMGHMCTHNNIGEEYKRQGCVQILLVEYILSLMSKDHRPIKSKICQRISDQMN